VSPPFLLGFDRGVFPAATLNIDEERGHPKVKGVSVRPFKKTINKYSRLHRHYRKTNDSVFMECEWQMSLKSPIPVFEERNFLPFDRCSNDIQVFASDHKINVARRFIDPKGMKFILTILLKIRIKTRETPP